MSKIAFVLFVALVASIVPFVVLVASMANASPVWPAIAQRADGMTLEELDTAFENTDDNSVIISTENDLDTEVERIVKACENDVNTMECIIETIFGIDSEEAQAIRV